MKKLSAEQMQNNWKKLLDTIEGFIDDDERSKEVYSLWDRLNDDTYEEDT